MKKVVLAIAFVAVGFVSCKNEKKDKVETKEAVTVVKKEVKEGKKGNVDVKTSVLNWKGTKPTGAHNGTVTLQNGNILVAENVLQGGEFVFDMNSINTLDLKEGKGKEDLDGHLKNEDFFNVAKYPTSKFVITSVKENDGKLAITGNLTVKETTKSITIPATFSVGNGVMTLKSDAFTINRTEFDIKYKSKSFFNNLKDKFIHDNIEFSFDVKTKQLQE